MRVRALAKRKQGDSFSCLLQIYLREMKGTYLHRSGPLLENGLTGQRIAMVDMVLLVLPAYPYLP